jgi:3-hydroxybutyryl-CoA dehydrogenase
MEFGRPFGPFGLMDIIGLDVIRDIEEQYFRNSEEERDWPPQFLEEMVKQRKWGVKSGQGFYAYPNPSYKNKDWLHKRGKYRENIGTKSAAMRKQL